MDLVRDHAMTAFIFGFFASSWFGWAQEKPPAGWPKWLGAGSVLSLLTAVAGAVYAFTHWSAPSALSEPGAMRDYGIIVGVEFTVAAIGAGVLAWRKRTDLMSAWICLVVGVHFWPMAPVLQAPELHVLGALLTGVAIGGPLLAKRRGLTVSAVVGVGAGVSLLAFALAAVVRTYA